MLRRMYICALQDAGRRLIWITPCKRSAARGRDAMHCVSTTPQWVELLRSYPNQTPSGVLQRTKSIA
jgi:hypothetical protein